MLEAEFCELQVERKMSTFYQMTVLWNVGIGSFHGNFRLVIIVVQFSHSVVSDSLRPHGLQHARPPCPSPAPGACSNSISIKSVMPSNHLILCRPLLLLPSVFPSIGVFSSESGLFASRGQSTGCFSFSISPYKEYSELISFKIDWFDPLAF